MIQPTACVVAYLNYLEKDEKRANLDHLMKAGIVPGKQQCGMLHIDAYLTH
jgi:hypothetical protein